MVPLKPFQTEREESVRSQCLRWFYKFNPSYFCSGATLEFISKSFREIHVKIPYNWRTQNYADHLSAGNMYSAVDPIFNLVLMKNLNKQYEIHEREGNIRFKKPAKQDLYGRFEITGDELQRIQDELSHHSSVNRVYKVELTDRDNKTCYASIDKTFEIIK